MMRISAAQSSLKGVALALLVTLLVLGGAAVVLKTTVDRLLYWDATAAAESWARYLAENVTDIEDIANGKAPSAASLAFLVRTQQIRYVFGFEIVDLHGNVQLSSDGMKKSGSHGVSYNGTAARAGISGKPIVSVKEGQPPARPTIYAEAYLPVVIDARPRAIVAAYVDLSEQQAQFRTTFIYAALALFLLGGIGAGIPTLAWHRITREKQRADRQMHDYAHRLRLALKAADAIVFEYDYATRQNWASDEMAAIIGPGRVPDASALPLNLFAEEDREELLDYARRMEENGELGGIDARLITAKGTRWVRLYAEIERQNNGETARAISLLLNIDEKKKQELALDAARKAAEAAGAAKSNFLASMSHEIRTPLNGVLGMAQSLHGDGLPPDQQQKVEIILDSGTTLMALLNDVLDLSKIEAGKMDIAPMDGDLRESVMRITQLFLASANEKGIKLKAAIDPAFPVRLNFDPVRVRQCVSNLLSNAIKFTPSGGCVDLRVNGTGRPDGGQLVTIHIADTGIGMDRETIGRLFSAFTQADGSTSRRFGGSGLGLAISRQLARAMNGDISVTSEPGIGSTFRMQFEAGAATALHSAISEIAPAESRKAEPLPGTGAALAGARILLVDDNAVNRQVIKLFLKPFGTEIREAANGQLALDLLRQSRFDLILLDVHMPVMDGCETIQAIRSGGEAWSDVPTIALTADAMSGDRERYLEMGMTDYLAKPVDQRELVSKITVALAFGADGASVEDEGSTSPRLRARSGP